jgi:DmsE family decaheme c-type cytochrome
MIPQSRIGRSASILLAAAWLLFSGGAGLPGMQQAHAQAPGPEACAGCHESQVKTFLGTKHGNKVDARTPISQGGCGSCHKGDFAAHIKASGGKGVGGLVSLSSKAIAQESKDQLCTGCHQKDPARMNWLSSTHANRDTGCTSCHQIHTSHDNVRDKLTQPGVCFTCHKEQRVQINKPYRHPTLEGKVSCSDCHNVHGSNPKQMVKSTVNEVCYTCHMEKRGPFVHNHQPVTEDCGICHNPHGTTIPALLKSRAPYLCQDCHQSSSHPSQAAGIPKSRTNSTSQLGTVARGCLNCHTNIHGSNSTQNSATTSRFRR